MRTALLLIGVMMLAGCGQQFVTVTFKERIVACGESCKKIPMPMSKGPRDTISLGETATGYTLFCSGTGYIGDYSDISKCVDGKRRLTSVDRMTVEAFTFKYDHDKKFRDSVRSYNFR